MRSAALGAAAIVLAACAANQTPDDAAVCDAFSNQRSRVEVVASGTVTRVLGVQSGPHEGFLMKLDSGCSVVVRVEANTDFTGEFALSQGDKVVVKGEYEYYGLGGVIHWTHRDPRNRHEGGFIQVAGKTYD